MSHARGCGVNCRCTSRTPACRVCNCGTEQATRLAAIVAAWPDPEPWRTPLFQAPPDTPQQEDQQ